MSSSREADLRRQGGLPAAQRLGDDRYCAPCGWLFWTAGAAAEHRREAHPEQALIERAPIEQPPRPHHPIAPEAAFLAAAHSWRSEPFA